MKKISILSAAFFGLMMSAPVAFADDITVAVVGPMTGQLATIGDQFKQGAQAAADAINAAGGVDGRQIKLSIQEPVRSQKGRVGRQPHVADGVKFIDSPPVRVRAFRPLPSMPPSPDDEPGLVNPVLTDGPRPV